MCLALFPVSLPSPNVEEPFLSTVHIRTRPLIEVVSRVSHCWAQMATTKVANYISSSPKGFDVLGQRLRSLEAISSDVATHVGHPAFSIFTAIDRAYKVQGIALATLGMDRETSIKYLETHPDNIPLPGQEMHRFHGAGTALVRHIALETLSRKNSCKQISLLSTETAQGFYQRLGFRSSSIVTFCMELQEPGLRALALGEHPHHQILVDDTTFVEKASVLTSSTSVDV